MYKYYARLWGLQVGEGGADAVVQGLDREEHLIQHPY